MSATTKRKHVYQEVLYDYALPTDNQSIVKVTSSRGNNLHEVQTPSGDTYLASMPCKFRKNVWIKRGDYVIVEPIEEGDRVKAEIVHILLKEHIRYIRNMNLWPKEFTDELTSNQSNQFIPDDLLPPNSSDDDDDGEERPEQMNLNRRDEALKEDSDEDEEEGEK